MVRKGTKLNRAQQLMFAEAAKSQFFCEHNQGDPNTFVQDMLRENNAVYNAVTYMISMMGWTETYTRYYAQEKILMEQDLA